MPFTCNAAIIRVDFRIIRYPSPASSSPAIFPFASQKPFRAPCIRRHSIKHGDSIKSRIVVTGDQVPLAPPVVVQPHPDLRRSRTADRIRGFSVRLGPPALTAPTFQTKPLLPPLRDFNWIPKKNRTISKERPLCPSGPPIDRPDPSSPHRREKQWNESVAFAKILPTWKLSMYTLCFILLLVARCTYSCNWLIGELG